MENLLVGKKEAAKMLSLSIRTLEYAIGRKELKTIRVGRRVLISAKSLRAFAQTNHPRPYGGRGSENES